MSGNTNDNNNKRPAVTAIKTIELEPGTSFTANGKKYVVNDTFTIGRFQSVVMMEEELQMLGDKDSCHDVMREAMDLINNHKMGHAYVLLYNKIESDQKSNRLMPFTLRMCTAYINYEGEDLGYLTEEQIITKIKDWSEEGLDIRPFFVFAVSVCQQLLQSYKQPIADILKEAKGISEVMNQLSPTEPDTRS